MSTEVYKDENYRKLVTTMLQNAVEIAEAAGLAITIERVPMWPLAMGNVEHLISVRQSLKAVRALAAEAAAEQEIPAPAPQWHCALPNDLKVHLFDRSLVKYEDPYPFAECDAAYKSRYDGIRPEMTLLQWRDLWVQGKTDLQIQRKKVESFAECDQAYNDWYHKCRAEMGLYDWRELWAKGETPKQKSEAAQKSRASNEISDREWAAQDPSLREGSTVRVPGVGEL